MYLLVLLREFNCSYMEQQRVQICIQSFMFCWPCIIMQISQTRCTILLNISIFLLYMFRASMCLSSGENNQCCLNIVIFSWWWAHGCPKHVEKRNKYIKQNCAPSWTYMRNAYKVSSSENKKIQKTQTDPMWMDTIICLEQLSNKYLLVMLPPISLGHSVKWKGKS